MNERIYAVLLEIANFKDSCSTAELETMLLAEQACIRAKVHASISETFDTDLFGGQ